MKPTTRMGNSMALFESLLKTWIKSREFKNSKKEVKKKRKKSFFPPSERKKIKAFSFFYKLLSRICKEIYRKKVHPYWHLGKLIRLIKVVFWLRRSACWDNRWWIGGFIDVVKDFANSRRILDEWNNLHWVIAFRALEWKNLKDSSHQHCPSILTCLAFFFFCWFLVWRVVRLAGWIFASKVSSEPKRHGNDGDAVLAVGSALLVYPKVPVVWAAWLFAPREMVWEKCSEVFLR